MTVTLDSVTKRTFGGTLNLSQQDVDWTEPSALDLVISDFGEYYAEVTEDAACDFLVDKTYYTAGYSQTTSEAFVQSIAYAALATYSRCKRMPDTMWVGLTAWAEMIAAADGDDKLILPQLGGGQVNITTGAFAGNPLGSPSDRRPAAPGELPGDWRRRSGRVL